MFYSHSINGGTTYLLVSYNSTLPNSKWKSGLQFCTIQALK